MTIMQLKCFQAVCKYKNYSIAAEQLYLSQSSVSKHIIALEEELNLELLERRGRHIEITEEGSILLRYFTTILSAYNQVQDVAEELRQKRRKEKTAIRIVGTPGMQRYEFLDSIRVFQAENSSIKTSLEDTEGLSAMNALESETCDFAFVINNEELDATLYDWIDICSDHIAVAMKKDYTLDEKSEIIIDELARYQFILPGRITLMYDVCKQMLEDINGETEIIHTTSRPSIGIDYLKSPEPRAFFWLKKSLIEYANQEYCIMDIYNSPEICYVLAWRKNMPFTREQRMMLDFFTKAHNKKG